MERVRLSIHLTPKQRTIAAIKKRREADVEAGKKRKADFEKVAYKHRVEVEQHKMPRRKHKPEAAEEVINFDKMAERNRLREKVARGLVLENIEIKTSARLYRALVVKSAGDKEWGIVQAFGYNRGASTAMLTEHDADLRDSMRRWMISGYFGMGAQFKIDTVPAPATQRVY